jgi:hypothetical protein
MLESNRGNLIFIRCGHEVARGGSPLVELIGVGRWYEPPVSLLLKDLNGGDL